MATLEDAHHVTLVVFKAAETREKAAVEECSSLREQITSLQGQLDGDTKRLQSKVWAWARGDLGGGGGGG